VIRDGCNKSLQRITDLKVEVNKNDKDTLSIGVIRKGDEIEKLARSAKGKMRLTGVFLRWGEAD
jgi:hypothetical protein